ncbi:MAG: serine/threonine-protein phosphatase [Actinobacteria bacterium]|nr:serine/threonine-protein phosphatase [Actinomycetota bacterium]
METPILAFVAVACGVAAVLWARSARRLRRLWRHIEVEAGADSAATVLARSQFRKELHTTTLYGVLALAAAVAAASDVRGVDVVFAVVLVPVVISIAYGKDFVRDSRLAEDRVELERRAEEILNQDQLAPQRWAERLAPRELPALDGFEVGKLYKAGTGLMAGDFFDLFRLAPTRVAAVIGDVTGHGIEPSITALQSKYLLRMFLRQFRDPAQALEELNARMSAEGGEELISVCVVVLDIEADALRWASAGHPTAWLWHDREIRPLRSTGPLLMLDAKGTYTSREVPLDTGDLLLLYTDGLIEARSGDHQFGEERVANMLRRDPGADPEVLCKTLLEAAKDFSSGPLADDVAILALRRA